MIEAKEKRRPKGQAALGNIEQTKIVATAMIDNDVEERRKKTERLKALRCGASEQSTTEA